MTLTSTINYALLRKYADAFISYERSVHNVDPRETLDGTIMRIKKEEGYKKEIYKKVRGDLFTSDSYSKVMMRSLAGGNLVNHHQVHKIVTDLKEKGTEEFENALERLFNSRNEKLAFDEIIGVIGAYFDVVGFLFFLKDCDRFLPIRSRLFDERFSLLGLKSELRGNCNWEKYTQFISWMGEIRDYLTREINKEITLLDAHSFVWILPKLDEFLDSEKKNEQVVEHNKYGKGIVITDDGDTVTIQFSDAIKKFDKEIVLSNGLLTYLDNGKEQSAREENSHEGTRAEEAMPSKKEVEVAEALLKLIANRTRLTTYGDLSNMTESKPSPYYEMRMLLDAINKRCDTLGLPYISAMVVNKNTGLPGEGFRELCINSFGYDPELSTEEIFETELDQIGKCDEWEKLADSLGITMPTEVEESLPEEIEEKPGETIVEGAKKTITVNAYERNPEAKKQCKDFYMKRDGRITCQVCGFDFGKIYGPEYANKIHVHHIVPVSEIGEEYVVDPVKDLIPVCPNCHMILHAGKGISIEELKKKIDK